MMDVDIDQSRFIYSLPSKEWTAADQLPKKRKYENTNPPNRTAFAHSCHRTFACGRIQRSVASKWIDLDSVVRFFFFTISALTCSSETAVITIKIVWCAKTMQKERLVLCFLICNFFVHISGVWVLPWMNEPTIGSMQCCCKKLSLYDRLDTFG